MHQELQPEQCLRQSAAFRSVSIPIIFPWIFSLLRPLNVSSIVQTRASCSNLIRIVCETFGLQTFYNLTLGFRLLKKPSFFKAKMRSPHDCPFGGLFTARFCFIVLALIA